MPQAMQHAFLPCTTVHRAGSSALCVKTLHSHPSLSFSMGGVDFVLQGTLAKSRHIVGGHGYGAAMASRDRRCC